MRALLKQHVDVNAAQGDGTTALHWAADLDNLTIADLLIRAGARVDAANDLGATPLHLACTNRSAAMVDRLAGSEGQCERETAQRRDRADDLRAHRRRESSEGAAGPWRRPEGEGAGARSDGADVGGRGESIRTWWLC